MNKSDSNHHQAFLTIVKPIRKPKIAIIFCKCQYFVDFRHVPDSTFLSRHFKTNLIEIGQVKRKLSPKILFFANVNYTVGAQKSNHGRVRGGGGCRGSGPSLSPAKDLFLGFLARKTLFAGKLPFLGRFWPFRGCSTPRILYVMTFIELVPSSFQIPVHAPGTPIVQIKVCLFP